MLVVDTEFQDELRTAPRSTAAQIKEDCRELSHRLTAFEEAWEVVKLSCADLLINLAMAQSTSVSVILLVVLSLGSFSCIGGPYGIRLPHAQRAACIRAPHRVHAGVFPEPIARTVKRVLGSKLRLRSSPN